MNPPFPRPLNTNSQFCLALPQKTPPFSICPSTGRILFAGRFYVVTNDPTPEVARFFAAHWWAVFVRGHHCDRFWGARIAHGRV